MNSISSRNEAMILVTNQTPLTRSIWGSSLWSPIVKLTSPSFWSPIVKLTSRYSCTVLSFELRFLLRTKFLWPFWENILVYMRLHVLSELSSAVAALFGFEHIVHGFIRVTLFLGPFSFSLLEHQVLWALCAIGVLRSLQNCIVLVCFFVVLV